MKKASLILVMLSVMCISAFSQIKTQYADSTEYGTTVVVKEDGASDLDILNSYGDNYMGGVIRITTQQEAPEAPKTVENEQPLVLAQTAKSKQVAGQTDTPKRVYKSKKTPAKRAVKPYVAPAFAEQAPAKITTSPSASPSEFDSSRLHSSKKGKLKRNKKRKGGKLFKGRRSNSCYRF